LFRVTLRSHTHWRTSSCFLVSRSVGERAVV
jgi:hypothetical protein